MSYSEALENNDIDSLRHYLADRFENLAYGMKVDSRECHAMEYLNLTVLDVVTGLFHGIHPEADIWLKETFVENLKKITDGLERYLHDCKR